VCAPSLRFNLVANEGFADWTPTLCELRMSNELSKKFSLLGAALAASLAACSGSGTETTQTLVVSPRGNDSNAGTEAAPFRSLKQALSVAKPGNRVQLENGSYDQASGETWAYTPSADVTITGDAEEQTLLQAPPRGSAGNLAALEAGSGLTLENVSLVGFDVGVDVAATARVSVHHVVIRDGRTAVQITGGDCAIDIADTTLSIVEGDGAALKLSDSSQPNQVSLEHASVTGGVFVTDDAATLSIADSQLDGNLSNAGVNFSGATLDIERSQIRALAAPYGISLRRGALSLSEASVEGGNYAVYQLSGSSKLRKSQLSSYASIGFYFAAGQVDLGTQAEAGNNAFTGRSGSSSAFGIYVDTGTAPVTSSNTSFDGVVPPAGVVQAGDAEIAQPGEYFITPGQSMQFFDVAEP
jgi:hypothetical protein